MTVHRLTPQHPITGAVLAAGEALTGVRDVQPLFMTPAQQGEALIAITRLEAKTAELKLRLLAAAGDAAEQAGARDVGAWHSHLTRTDVPTARGETRLAEAVDRTWTQVAAGMADGQVSTAQAQVVVHALDALPDHLDPALIADAETRMVDYCHQFRPAELRRLGRHLLEVIAPEIAEAELAKQLQNEEQQAREKTSLRTRHLGQGLARTTITHPVIDQDRLLTYLDAYTSPRKSVDAVLGEIGGEEDRIPHHRRLGHAFSALLEHLDPNQLPAHGGDATTVLVTITLNALRTELGTGSIVGGEDLSATAIRRLGCTANILPVVLGGNGEILDLGRSRRLFSPAQRKAMRLRDQHCRADGCTVPAARCEVHHDQPWTQGGNTNINHGRHYCPCHHHRTHDPNYTTQILPNGDTRFHRRT